MDRGSSRRRNRAGRQAAAGGAVDVAEALESAIARFGAADASDDRALLVIRVQDET